MFKGKSKKDKLVVEGRTKDNRVRVSIEIQRDFWEHVTSGIININANTTDLTLKKSQAAEHLEEHLKEVLQILAPLIAGIITTHPVFICYGFNGLVEALMGLAKLILHLTQELERREGDFQTALDLIKQIETHFAQQSLGDEELLEFLLSTPNIAESA